MEKANPAVDKYIAKAGQWRQEVEALRRIVLGCRLIEEMKWGQPCYTHQGSNIVLIHTFKEYCALLFFKGALLKDPQGILVQQTKNTQATRQIRFTEVREIVDQERPIKEYIKEAVEVEKGGLKVEYKKTAEFEVPAEFQQKLEERPDLKAAFEALTPGRQKAYLLHFAAPKQSTTRVSRIEKCLQQILEGKGLNDHMTGKGSSAAKRPAAAKEKSGGAPVLLSGGNPQIAKGDGDGPVQAYIAAMPDWKSDAGRRLDKLIVRTVPQVRKAVRWNSPFYGIEGRGWFLSFHCFAKYIKVTFLNGTSLKPLPPVESKHPNVRYFHIQADEPLDEKMVANWIRQGAELPGDPLF